MSSGSDGAQLAAEYESLFVNNCCGIATTVLLVFEYLITLDREVELFWRRKFTGASVLFLLNRYLPLSVTILEACGCSVWIFAEQTLYLFQYPLWAALAALRAFALSGRNWCIAVLIFLLALVPLGINIADYPFRHSVNDPIVGCAAYLDQSPTLSERTARLHIWSTLSSISTFTTTLLRDGTLYFFVLFTLNCPHLAFTTASFANDALVSISYVTIFTDPITAVLLNRFLMNLQEVNRSTVVGVDGSSAIMSSSPANTDLNFARFLGSLGNSLAYSHAELETMDDPEETFSSIPSTGDRKETQPGTELE
ncbi:hypothetical protein OH77DRAFT_1521558 [Trametes cingulata]|nr:hypothetical protein OH77DRAFT_1521558 [Trametes cingulata]